MPLLLKCFLNRMFLLEDTAVILLFVLPSLDLQNQVQGWFLSLPPPQVSVYSWPALVHCPWVQKGQSAGIYACTSSKVQVTILLKRNSILRMKTGRCVMGNGKSLISFHFFLHETQNAVKCEMRTFAALISYIPTVSDTDCVHMMLQQCFRSIRL